MTEARWLVLTAVSGLYFCFGLGFSSVAPLVPVLSSDLEISPSQIGIVLGSWQFVFILTSIPATMLILRIGLRAGLTLAGLIILASLFLRGFSGGFVSLLLPVAMLGFGAPIVSIATPMLVATLFQGRLLSFAIGICVAAPYLANMLTFSLSASVLMPLLQNDWRLVFSFWVVVALVLVVFWCLVAWRSLPSGGLDGMTQTRKEPQRQDLGQVLWICLTGALIFFVDHAFKSWVPEIAREAGYPIEVAGFLAATSIGLAFTSLLIVPSLITDNASRARVMLGLTLTMSIGAMIVAVGEPGPVFFVALCMMGFASAPLLPLGLLPIVRNESIGPKERIFLIAFFFAAAQIGGSLGPIVFGHLREVLGNFDVALIGLAVVSLSINACVRNPHSRQLVAGKFQTRQLTVLKKTGTPYRNTKLKAAQKRHPRA